MTIRSRQRALGLMNLAIDALLIVLQRALLFYLQHPEEMREMQLRAMRKDFSWIESAKEYIKMYDLALEAHIANIIGRAA